MSLSVRLLIADDSDFVRRAICNVLKEEPRITVSGEARTYAELLKMLNESKPEVVLMDVHMPDEEQFAPATIKDHLSGSCLLAMSIFADEETNILAQSYGAFTLLDKMDLGSRLIPAIEECTREKKKSAVR